MSDDIDLRLITDDEDWPKPPPPEPAGHVDVTARLSNGQVWRVATVGADIVLTIVGADGMASLRLGPNDAQLLGNALSAAELDANRTRRGAEW